MESADGAGGVTRDYDVVATLWAKVDAGLVRARVWRPSGSVQRITHRIVIRFSRRHHDTTPPARRRPHLSASCRCATAMGASAFCRFDAEEIIP